MKKETVNQFTEGLNYDFNPLVTPNNILTDAVNGTFITLNGNELSLQNDAGNIVLNVSNSNETIPTYDPGEEYFIGEKVAVTDSVNRVRYYICIKDEITGITPSDDGVNWREYTIRLSPGFYPLGIKEFGGVLYIVSAKHITKVATIFDKEGTYPIDHIIVTDTEDTENDPNIYWKSLTDNNDNNESPILIDGGGYWERLGNYSEASDFDEIEFGSYPSPEAYNQDSFLGGDSIIEMVSGIPNVLYSPKAINDALFKPGTYIKFEESSNDFTYLTDRNTTNFYILKLYQQLTSGFIDLSEDIEIAYEAYITKTGNTPAAIWILDPTFIYSCPFLYKGKLFLSLEIEPLLKFEATPPTITELITTDKFFEINFDVESDYESGTKNIQAKDITVDAYYEDGTQVDASKIVITNDSGDNKNFSVVITVLQDYLNQEFNIIINPIYSYDSNIITDKLPPEYTKTYKLEEQIILNTLYNNITFQLDPTLLNNACGTGDNEGFLVYKELVLTDLFGNPLNFEGEVSNTKYSMIANYLDGNGPLVTIPETDHELLGTFSIATDGSISDGSINFIIPPDTPELEYIIRQNLIAINPKVETSACETITLTINVSGQTTADISVFQPYYSTTETLTNVNSGSFDVISGTKAVVTITPKYAGDNTRDYSYELITDNTYFTEDIILNYVLVANLGWMLTGTGNQILIWDNALDLGEPDFTANQSFINFNGLLKYTSLYGLGGIYRNVFYSSNLLMKNFGFEFPRTASIISYGTSEGTTLTGSYRNISDNDHYSVIQSVVFHNSNITPPQITTPLKTT